MELNKLLSGIITEGDVYEIIIKSGSLIVDIIFRKAKNTTIVRTFNRVKDYSFNITLDNGTVIKKPASVQHNLSQSELRYTGGIITEDSCKKDNELKEFQDFMSMFAGTPQTHIQNPPNGRKGKNIVQYMPQGSSNIFSPFMKIA